VWIKKAQRLKSTSTMVATRDQYRQGNKIVARALHHNLIPEFKKNRPLKEQSTKTRFALHILAVMSKDYKPDISDVKRVICETIDLFEQ